MNEENIASEPLDLGYLIKNLRTYKKMTLREVAEKTGINDGYLSLLENNKRSFNEENFYKIMIVLGASEIAIKRLWTEYIEEQNPDKQIAAKSLASKKYKVVSRGFDFENNYDVQFLVLTIRWVINGKIYLWKIVKDTYNQVSIKDPLNNTTHDTNWITIVKELKRDESLLLFDAILNELEKEISEDKAQNAVIYQATQEIEDLRDSVETLNIDINVVDAGY